ncbi:MAG: 5-dehydro-4-deoxy-D-glucuronate isomerase [Terracidiphilus sp.]
MKKVLLADPVRYPRMTTGELRETFLLSGMHEPGKLNLAYVDLDRTIAGMAAPLGEPIALPNYPDLRANCFTDRRELGVLSIGGSGRVTVGGEIYDLENLDMLYIGRGNAEVSFASKDAKNPAIYYLLSYPAHTVHPVALIRKQDAQSNELGSAETCNRRTISRYIHLQGAKSCQLVMGVTHLAPGSSWNTMPPHTHDRRSEVYMYFNLAANSRVVHLMGPADETRHLIMADKEIVVSPGWSIHAGVGTTAYSFCWGMGGENQDYADMDAAPIESLR